MARPNKQIYPTWQEAGAAARKLGIRCRKEYQEMYHMDPRLHVNPYVAYSDFPGIKTFLGTGFYGTWQEASAAARRLSIRSQAEYFERYSENPKLPSNPYVQYKKQDFPGMEIFLGLKPYGTWQAASVAANELGIISKQGYQDRYLEDPRLPELPYREYLNFPGWGRFLAYGRKT